MSDLDLAELPAVLERFIEWLDEFGGTSYDHQTYFAGDIGKWAKSLYYRYKLLGTLAVAPMIFSEAFFPWARGLFGPRLRFPIADAHYAMGFARLAQTSPDSRFYEKALEYLRALESSRCPDYEKYCWGYPFDWMTQTGVMAKDTPLITTTPYVYEAFFSVYAIDGDTKWLNIMRSIAEHAYSDIKDRELSDGSAAAGYNPMDTNGVVINASAYRAFLLFHAANQFDREEFARAANRNLKFALESQRPDGSWPYAADGVRSFVDHFHTCFVLKALAKIEQLIPEASITKAIEAGVGYYVEHLFDSSGLPQPFSEAPRLTLYRKELYDYAESINLAVLLRNRFPSLDDRLTTTMTDLLSNWRKPDGSFKSRRLLIGWDTVPMHRWAQAQLFRSLCLLMSIDTTTSKCFARTS